MRVTYAENLDLRAENRRGPGGGFETITQEIYTKGTMPVDQMEHLCERAQNVGFTHNTLPDSATVGKTRSSRSTP